MLNTNSTIYQSIRPTDLSNVCNESYCLTRHMCNSMNSDRKIKAYLYQIADRFDVVLKKGSQGFGLTLVDDLVIDNLKLLKVKAIYKDGPAAKSGIIQPGDVLSAFNQIDIIGVQPDEVIKMFKVIKEKESIILTVWKIVPKPRMRIHHNLSSEIVNFYLQKSEGGFGFILGNCKDEHQVAKVNGSGDVQILLQANDKITSIGRVSIDHLPHDQVVNLLKKFPKNHYLQFTIMRDSPTLTRSVSNESCHNMDYSMNSSIYSKISRNIDSQFYNPFPGVGTSGPCNTPDFIPATHFLSLHRHEPSKIYQQTNYDPPGHIPSSYSTETANLIADMSQHQQQQPKQQPDFIPDTFVKPDDQREESHDIFTVQLTRSSTKGFGFRLMGGSEEGCQVYIGAIIPKGPVDECGVINCGDVIKEINNIPTDNKTHSEVVTLLDEAARSSNGQLSLSLQKACTTPWETRTLQKLDDACRTVVLTRNPDEGFGFVIVSAVNPIEPCGIGRINPGSAADLCKQLHLGDRILSVNGHSLHGLHYKAVMKIIKQSDLSIQLTVRDGDINRLKTIKYELPRPSEPDIELLDKSDPFSEIVTQPVSIMKSTSQFDKQIFRTSHNTSDEEIVDTSQRSTRDSLSEIQSDRDAISLLVQRR